MPQADWEGNPYRAADFFDDALNGLIDGGSSGQGGGGPVVVYLHGNAESRSKWNPVGQPPLLLQHERRECVLFRRPPGGGVS